MPAPPATAGEAGCGMSAVDPRINQMADEILDYREALSRIRDQAVTKDFAPVFMMTGRLDQIRNDAIRALNKRKPS